MPNRTLTQLIPTFLSQENSDDILKGVVVCEVGEAKGHGFYLGEKFMEQVVQIGNRKQIKVRLDHPEEGQCGKLLSIVGQAFNFRLDGEKVRADIRLFDVPAKKIIQQLAKQASNLFGMSIAFIGKAGKKMKNGLEEVFCKDFEAVDFVESPAATTALFSEKVDSQKKEETKTDKNSENLNNENYMDKEILAALGLEEGADEESIKKAILAVCSAKKEMDDKSKGDESKLSDEEKSKADEADKKKKDDEEAAAALAKKSSQIQLSEKQISEIVASQVARQFTALAAKIGGKPKIGQADGDAGKSQEDKDKEANFGFNAEEIAFAKKEGIELKSWRATLSKAAEKTIHLSK